MYGQFLVAAFFVAGSAAAPLPPLRPGQPLALALRADQPLAPVTIGLSARPIGPSRSATDGTNFFIVERTESLLLGTRITPGGEALDTPSIVIAADLSDNVLTFEPRHDVIYTGEQYVVAYSTGSAVVTERISQDGRILDAAPRTVSSGKDVRLAWNGHNILLVADGKRLRLLDRDGNPASAEQTVALPLPANSVAAAAASNGRGFLVAETTFRDGVRLLQVDDNGVISSRTLTLGSGLVEYAMTAEVASNGADYLILTTSHFYTAYTIVVHGNGSADDVQVLPGVTPSLNGSLAVVWNGNEYVAAIPRKLATPFPFNQDIAVFRLAPDGARVGELTPLVHTWLSIEALQSNGSECLLLTRGGDAHHVWRGQGRIFRPGASTMDSTTLTGVAALPREQTMPAIASNGTHALAVWREDTDLSSGGEVRAALIDPSGAVGDAFRIWPDSSAYSRPAVASNGQDFMVFWNAQSGRVLARRVRSDGSLPDFAPSDAGAGSTAMIAAAWSGRAYVAVWTTGPFLHAAGFTPEGISLTPANAAPAITAVISTDNPSVACNAGGCVAAVRSVLHPGEGTIFPIDEGVFVARLSSDGVVSGPQSVIKGDRFVSDVVVMARPDGATVFFARNASIYSFNVSAGTSAVSLGDTNAQGVFAAIGDRLYLIDGPKLRWARINVLGRVAEMADIDTVSPAALTASSSRLFVVYAVTDPAFGTSSLFLRTLAAPQSQARRRAAR